MPAECPGSARRGRAADLRVIFTMCSTLHCVHEYYSHHAININETWGSKIQMMGLELGDPATPLLA